MTMMSTIGFHPPQ